MPRSRKTPPRSRKAARRKPPRNTTARFKLIQRNGKPIDFTVAGESFPKARKNGIGLLRRAGYRDVTKNVAAGFFAGGSFHPIRASEDYDPSRGGGNFGRKKVRTKKAQAKYRAGVRRFSKRSKPGRKRNGQFAKRR